MFYIQSNLTSKASDKNITNYHITTPLAKMNNENVSLIEGIEWGRPLRVQGHC